VLVLFALMAITLFAAIGMSVDIGRMFIAKHEAQVFTDAGALAAALQLDGTTQGTLNALAAVDNSSNRWDLGTRQFSGSLASHTVKFATSSSGPWLSQSSLPNPPTAYKFVQVQASVSVKLYFAGVVIPQASQTVKASSVAGQTPITKMYQGAFPFTPMAFDATDPTVGFTQDVQYTIRYPSGKNKPPCAGDQGFHTRDSSDRGYWGDNSASVIRQRIVDDYQSGAVAIIGQSIGLSGGAKTSESSYLDERSLQDPDQTSMTWADYKASNTANGRRLVVMPITNYNTGIALGFASFLLLPAGNYDHTGNAAWCAVYVGPWTQDQKLGGASTTAGAYQVELVQ
jgi:hypothetical protein